VPHKNKKMFRGNNPARVDEKGRLKVPADFKRTIDEKYSAEFYITSRDGRVGEIYPMEEWRKIEEKLAKLSNFNPSKKKFLNKVNYYGQMVEMDAQGRLLMPQILREAAGIKGDVAVYGNLTYLEVRNLEVSKQLAEEQFTTEDEKTLDELGI
jgi:transcriptional regulator MraZ